MNMKINQLFIAYHKLLGNIKYKYLGEEKQPNGYNIKLLNLNDGTFTFVEKEWFNQRKIKLLD